MDVVKFPGPDHSDHGRRQSGQVAGPMASEGHVIADTASALILKEASYRPVAYFPRKDVDMAFLTHGTGLDTYCPYKGHAGYFSLDMDGHIAENAVWTYETPHAAMAVIAGRLAFYPNLVTIEEIPADRGAVSVDAVVRHTDSGAGRSQAEHWAPTARDPV